MVRLHDGEECGHDGDDHETGVRLSERQVMYRSDMCISDAYIIKAMF